MSLLLEALKKAEKAKEEAQRRAKGEEATELRLEGDPAPSLVTRAEPPDIRQPLEIVPDPKPAAPEKPRPRATASAQAEAQATGRKVFEAKFEEPNPRLPFYITVGLLAVFAAGTAGYFWYQLRPPAPLVNANPPKTGFEMAAPATPVKPAPVFAEVKPPAIPGLPTTEPVPAAKPEAAIPSKPKPPAPAPAPRIAAPEPVPLQAAPVAQTRLPPQVHPKVDTGYAAYLAGDLAAARADYQEALREDGGNRDALLGLAAIDVRTGRYEAAEATYLRLLQADPNDAHAHSGLIALRASRMDPLATESRVKNLLAADPGANVLHFTLGNQLAQQGRWAEAQQEYFKAFAADPDNADFAYNLAISLDHLRQSRLALEYYRRAIALAERRGAGFDVAAARNRAAQLGN